jgi:hypothetical protein
VLARIDQEDEWLANSVGHDYGDDSALSMVPGIAAIVAADPGFDETAFLERVEMTFFLLEKAWQDRDAEAAKPYLWPPLLETFSKGSEALTAAHERAVLENLNVQGMEILNASHGTEGDQVVVRIDAVAAAHLVQETGGAFVAGDQADRRFSRQWTFGRAAGLTTPAAGGVLAQKCPACGAPLKLDQTGHCPNCGAVIAAGEKDWVLTAIDGQPVWPELAPAVPVR